MNANIPSKILLQREGKLRTKFHGEKISLKERTDVIFTGHWAFLLFSFFLLFFFVCFLFFVLFFYFLFFCSTIGIFLENVKTALYAVPASC